MSYSLTVTQMDDLEHGCSDPILLAIAMPQLIRAARKYLDSEIFREEQDRSDRLASRWAEERDAARRKALRSALSQFHPFEGGAFAPFAVPA